MSTEPTATNDVDVESERADFEAYMATRGWPIGFTKDDKGEFVAEWVIDRFAGWCDAKRHERKSEYAKYTEWLERRLAIADDIGAAAGGISPTSCLACGCVGEPSTCHMEHPDIYVCSQCCAWLAAKRDAQDQSRNLEPK